MKHTVPMASPLLNASYEGFILPSFPNLTQMITNVVNHSIDRPNFPNLTQMITNGMNHSIGCFKFTTQLIDKAIPLIGDPILTMLLIEHSCPATMGYSIAAANSCN
ncbi:hypothetical protein V6N12_071413 [Hibiscus sabdariffa]|uniref:Uncharacterized protein n=1 Tax=Hibiscus sabdariffa TaxID=183260 RepID=A0ABR2FJR1_9ROSI